ncbi:UDP-N-acetylglucosamine--N-acetylmuramyl-(pentapeptide) pyrophosphoryl-undecaprenol N-acetylglucosamine transferase [Fretibacterium fastidiosum]|uniref:UDP-N-acetylglucosamine:LPS N-acetylglucosamine transferase n=1 Tax=Fretibacterium fastidiosum TaxID=651822 RepID=A0AB94IXL6_9BACT|nr:UDP-N-acetylglucosamine--N-acetylmuramyl-(pentapeptide) pyrophosphoryl-undecaprenol N-acetylglucosamine transferase [Fretibacterium fastidiosum]CBL28491.1 UDP-N-acetylglucosamine:LPS N-acetylglucosamine transferase [Fretibacterium fastidiosum]
MRAGDGASARSALIVAGGTGGHIFPALVFGRWLEAHCGAAVSYLSGSRPLEAEIYAAAGVTPFRLSLEGSPLGVRSPLKVLRRSLALVSAFGEVSRRLAEVRPTTAFLFGGYVSFAPLLLCRLRGIPVVFHEQNAVAGRVTRLASRLGAVIASGWEECQGRSRPSRSDGGSRQNAAPSAPRGGRASAWPVAEGGLPRRRGHQRLPG